jgi:hypothetical protein
MTHDSIDRHYRRQTEEMLKQVAHDRGGEFLEAFNQFSPQPILPFAGLPATETKPPQIPSTTLPMKLEITIPDELFHPLVQAIDRLTEAVKNGGLAAPRCDSPTTCTSDTATTTVVEAPAEGADKPKAGRPKKVKETPAEPAPAPVAAPVVEAVVEPASAPVEAAPVEVVPAAVPVPSGPDLAVKAGTLIAHPELQQELIRFKANELKINGPIRLVTDEEQLRLFSIKLDELLAKIPAEV